MSFPVHFALVIEDTLPGEWYQCEDLEVILVVTLLNLDGQARGYRLRHPGNSLNRRMVSSITNTLVYLFDDTIHNNSRVFIWVNPCSAGGKYYPLPYFLHSSKMTADIDAKIIAPYSIILLSSNKISEKYVDIF